LEPTRIYVKELLAARPRLLAAAHVTGGGLPGNVPRVLPPGTGARLDRAAWTEPPIFGLLRDAGRVDEDSMLRTFNCGLGMVLVTRPERADALAAELGGSVAGEVVPREGVVVA